MGLVLVLSRYLYYHFWSGSREYMCLLSSLKRLSFSVLIPGAFGAPSRCSK